mmetsp:Transcript_6806/g.17402  ORF Transcript_6806/g.17402 Transcript_6806/m.17402 type:complete len:217 (+) Transcript_6806:724-1374(+)
MRGASSSTPPRGRLPSCAPYSWGRGETLPHSTGSTPLTTSPWLPRALPFCGWAGSDSTGGRRWGRGPSPSPPSCQRTLGPAARPSCGCSSPCARTGPRPPAYSTGSSRGSPASRPHRGTSTRRQPSSSAWRAAFFPTTGASSPRAGSASTTPWMFTWCTAQRAPSGRSLWGCLATSEMPTWGASFSSSSRDPSSSCCRCLGWCLSGPTRRWRRGAS